MNTRTFITVESVQNRIVAIFQDKLDNNLKKQVSVREEQIRILELQPVLPSQSTEQDNRLKSLDDQLAKLEEEELEILLDQAQRNSTGYHYWQKGEQ